MCTQSRNLLSSCTRRQWSLASLAGSDYFPYSLQASCGALAPFRLCSRRQPQSSLWDLTSEARASVSSPHPPQRVSRQASQADVCWLAPSSVWESLRFALCTPVAVLSSVALKLPPRHPPSLVKGLPSVWKLFLLHSSLPEVQVPSLFFCVFFFLFSFALPRYVWIFLPFWKSVVFCQCSVGVLQELFHM